MSFNQGSGSGTLSFRPATFNVDWDGVSDAKATFELACWDTAATYSAVAYPVFRSSGELECTYAGQTSQYPYALGQRVFALNGLCQPVPLPEVTLPLTAANALATIRFSAITSVSYAHAWRLTATKGTSARVIIEGRVTPFEQNPYAQSGGPSVSLVSGVTAAGCF